MYYKFRYLNNYKYILDILLNQRLYSSSFRKLNDNLEGQFITDVFEKGQRFRLNPKKQEHLSICSFSGNYKNHLMWSHYADGHRGIVIGFEVDSSIYNIEKVNYDGLLTFDFAPSKFKDIKKIFVNKIGDFNYEDEYRIITEKQDYVTIEIKEIFFGAETPESDKKLISKLAKIVVPEITIDTFYG